MLPLPNSLQYGRLLQKNCIKISNLMVSRALNRVMLLVPVIQPDRATAPKKTMK